MLLGTPSDLGVGLPLPRRDVGNEHTRVHFHRSLLACFHLTSLYLTWVTPGASTARTCSSCTSASPRLSRRRAPSPSTTGTTWSSSSSSSPAARYCCATWAPPQSMTSLPPAASLACSSADSIPSVTKWNVVPPSISTGSRG